MSVCANGWLIWLLAVGSTTPRTALLLILIAALLLMIGRAVVAACRKLSLPAPVYGSVLLSFGMGAVLYPVIQRLITDADILQPTAPLMIAVSVFAGAAAHENTALLPYRTVPTLLLVGSLREVLSEGTLWGIPLLPMELSPAFGNGVGGLLVAAVVLWCCGLHPSLFREDDSVLPSGVVGVAVALGALAGLFTATLPTWMTLWGALLIGTVCFAFLPSRYTTHALVVVVPLAAWITREVGNRWLPPLLGVGAVFAAWLLAALVRHCRLTSPPSRFAGVPSALTVSAMIYSLVNAI